MKILFACGGTAGHINPALAIADLLKRTKPNLSIVFVGTPEGMENRLVTSAGYLIRHVPVKGLRRSLSPSNLKAGVALIKSFRVAARILSEEKPDLVIGTGGYVCYPLLRAASARGIKTVLHESNARAGVAARLLARHVDLALIHFSSAAKDFKRSGRTIVSGNPLRHEFSILNRDEARRKLGLTKNTLYLLVFGGSLGAQKLNETVEGAIPRLLLAFPTLTVLHATGAKREKTDVYRPNGRYQRTPYIDDMPLRLTAADAVVCRAGAMTVSEIAAAGVPAILVPYPAAAGDHQTKNAAELQKSGAAILVPDRELTPDRLTKDLSKLLSDGDERERMKANLSRFRVPETESVILREIGRLCPSLVDYS
ncbi:MAG: undecaprenyldiphospho-muramoylpentapeptide beta-N-acetylglucosaminyltransferase [Clostridia bacterium]|nr:undecaprenyldiphospho-muramoylpentapeptide beta-N-acetylglucosaminyltransferase [Clostridia bacterium]